ncbi:MAG: hypothetical protein V1929_06020 [bacterium]
MSQRIMTTPHEQAAALKREADQLLVETNLRAVLAKHGTVTFTGSYFYDLMTWRDLDICLPIAGEPMLIASEIVAQICKSNAVASIYIRNEHVLMTEGNPKAVFVCTEFLHADREIWKVDILLGSPELVAQTIAPGRELVLELTTSARDAILLIKAELCTRPNYRQEIKSTDIYRAVLDGGVRDLSGWEDWWKNNKKAVGAGPIGVDPKNDK